MKLNIKKVLLIIVIFSFSFALIPAILPINETSFVSEAASVKISKKSYTMNKGENFTLNISGTNRKVKWSTSDKSIATVNSKGKVTAKKKGKVTITAKVNGKKYKCKITVEEPKLNKTNCSLIEGKTVNLKVKNTTQKIKWSSSNKGVAKINSKGKITAIGSGDAIITAKVGKTKYTCNISVMSMEDNLANNLSMEMIIPHNGTNNSYAEIKITNFTGYKIKINAIAFFNGFTCYGCTWANDCFNEKFELSNNYYIQLDYHRSFMRTSRFDNKYTDMYLDSNSTGKVGIQVDGISYFVTFNSLGTLSVTKGI